MLKRGSQRRFKPSTYFVWPVLSHLSIEESRQNGLLLAKKLIFFRSLACLGLNLCTLKTSHLLSSPGTHALHLAPFFLICLFTFFLDCTISCNSFTLSDFFIKFCGLRDNINSNFDKSRGKIF